MHTNSDCIVGLALAMMDKQAHQRSFLFAWLHWAFSSPSRERKSARGDWRRSFWNFITFVRSMKINGNR